MRLKGLKLSMPVSYQCSDTTCAVCQLSLCTACKAQRNCLASMGVQCPVLAIRMFYGLQHLHLCPATRLMGLKLRLPVSSVIYWLLHAEILCSSANLPL